MLTQQQVEQFHANGFLNAGPVLPTLEVQRLRDEIMRTIEERTNPDIPQPVSCRNLTPRDDEPIWQIVDIWLSSEPLPGVDLPSPRYPGPGTIDRRPGTAHLARPGTVQAAAEGRRQHVASGCTALAHHRPHDRR